MIVPNERLAEIVINNYTLSETAQAALVQVGAAYASDPEEVERVTVDGRLLRAENGVMLSGIGCMSTG